MRDVIELSQEVDGLKILPSAVLVGDPLAVFARIIEVEHRGDSIDAQTINMEAVTPKQRVRQKEIADFMAAIIEYQRTPILVGAFARAFVLIECGPVKPRQSPIITWEMG